MHVPPENICGGIKASPKDLTGSDRCFSWFFTFASAPVGDEKPADLQLEAVAFESSKYLG